MLLEGDCIDRLKELPDNSVDSCVSDPPYGLSFMGKRWDYDVPSIAIWTEVLRVLKPGAHALIACGTRTQHRMVLSVEDAGFEVRDVITWHYGSGFPKSMSIDKALDKAAGAEREVVGPSENRRASHGRSEYGTQNSPNSADFKITAPATDLAKQWAGWGTALKPATEFWTLVRKPLIGTVVENVKAHGTGGLNIDGSRIGLKPGDQKGEGGPNAGMSGTEFFGQMKTSGDNRDGQGRWPANLILDEFAAEELDRQTGDIRSRNGYGIKGQTGGGTGSSYVMPATSAEVSTKVVREDQNGYLGGASRFFYVAKASKSERNAGLEGMPLKKPAQEYGLKAVEGNPRKPANCTASRPVANHHPTVKPLKLMEYLVRMVTPPGGTCLDPFMGSGTTGLAAKNLGFKFIGIEREPEYMAIAKKRLGL